MKNKLLLAFAMLIISTVVHTQQYSLDSSFSGDGVFVSQYGAPNSINLYTRKISLYANGKILQATNDNFGYYSNCSYNKLSRLNADGTIDTTFNRGGLDCISAEKLLSSGKILCSTSPIIPNVFSAFITRLNYDGNIDSSFGVNGNIHFDLNGFHGINAPITTPYGMTEQASGKVLIWGHTANNFEAWNFVLRIHADGSIDTTFGDAGVVLNPFTQITQTYINTTRALISEPDNSMYVLIHGTYPNSYAIVAKYKADGSIDYNFSTSGYRLVSRPAYNIEPTWLGKNSVNEIFIAGYYNIGGDTPSYFISHVEREGITSPFGNNGMLYFPYPMFNSEYVQYSSPTITAKTNIYPTVLMQPDDKIILGGTSDSTATSHFKLLRINPTGVLDNTFGNNGFVTVPRNKKDIGMCGALQPNGRILLGGMVLDAPNKGAFVFRLRHNGLTNGIANSNKSNFVLKVYPNPAQEFLNIEIKGKAAMPTTYELEIINLVGKSLDKTSKFSADGQLSYQLRLGDALPAGLYYIRVRGGDGNVVARKFYRL